MKGLCVVDDCERDRRYTNGFCKMHWRRWKVWGDPLYSRASLPPIDRFAEKVALTDAGCLVWIASVNEHGYGYFGIKDQVMLAHRWSYEYFYGPPGDLMVLHDCDNPPCVHPDHLHAGTHTDNMREAKERGRTRGGTPETCINGHPFTTENRYVKPNGETQCRGCRREYDRRPERLGRKPRGARRRRVSDVSP